MTRCKYAELPTEIPPPGNRKLRLKPSKILVICTLFLVWLLIWAGCATLLIRAEVVGLTFASVFIACGLILPAWLCLQLWREHQILSVGTALLAKVTGVLPENERWAAAESGSPPSINYSYRHRDRLWEFAKLDEGEELGDLTVIVVPHDPKRHVVLRSAFYRIVRESLSD